VNKVILVGNLGADPEVKYLQSGTAVANLRVATSQSWKDRESGERQERTEWHRVVLFARLAEIAGEYLRKGSKVYLEGRLQTRSWEDSAGATRYSTEVVVGDMQMLDTPRDGQQQAPAPSGNAGGGREQDGGKQATMEWDAPSGGGFTDQAGAADEAIGKAGGFGSEEEPFSDDIPF